MGMHYKDPVIDAIALNPAQQLVTKNQMILGVTIPTYNDKAIDGGIYADTATAAIGIDQATGKSKILRIFSFLHAIGFNVSIVGDGPWIADSRDASFYKKLLEQAGIKSISDSRLYTGIDYSTFEKLEIRPNTSYASVREQSLHHELQHCVDFREVAKTIFEPYSNWTDDMCSKSNPFTYKDGTTKNWILQGGYGGLSLTLINCYLEATKDLGDSFHKTPYGQPPKLKFVAVENKTVVLQLIEPAKRPVNFWGSPPHGYLQINSITKYSDVSTCYVGPTPCSIPPITLTQEMIDKHEKPEVVEFFDFF